jgi:rhodanese-related sulfurtransferase
LVYLPLIVKLLTPYRVGENFALAVLTLLIALACKSSATKDESAPQPVAGSVDPLVKTGSIKNVGPQEFKKLHQEKGGTLLDVRTPAEVAQARLGGASVVDSRDPDFEKKVDKLAKDKPVFVYCRSGGRSSGAAKILLSLGFSEIYNLKGGITDWMSAGLPTERSAMKPAAPAAPQISPQDFDALVAESPALLVDFHTQWCSPCEQMASVMDKLGQKHGDDTVALVDVDVSEELASREKIEGVPVFVLYESGKETFRHAGLISLAALDEKLTAALTKGN